MRMDVQRFFLRKSTIGLHQQRDKYLDSICAGALVLSLLEKTDQIYTAGRDLKKLMENLYDSKHETTEEEGK